MNHEPPRAADPTPAARTHDMRSPQYTPRRSAWPGLLAAGLLGATLGGVLIFNQLDSPAPPPAAQAPVQTDASITASVKAALSADPALGALPIEVTTQQGVVTLEGPAPDEQARQRAQTLATAPKGVKAVANHLVVRAGPLT